MSGADRQSRVERKTKETEVAVQLNIDGTGSSKVQTPIPFFSHMRIESYVVKGEHCVWDLLYVAEPSAFDATRGDFQALVESFVTD